MEAMKLADVSIIRLQTLIETYRESKLENGSCWYYVAVEFCLRLLRPLTEMTLNNHPLPPLKTLKGLMEDLERICYHSVKLRAQTDIKSTMKLQAQIRALLLRQINFISSHTWKSSKRNRLAGVQKGQAPVIPSPQIFQNEAQLQATITNLKKEINCFCDALQGSLSLSAFSSPEEANNRLRHACSVEVNNMTQRLQDLITILHTTDQVESLPVELAPGPVMNKKVYKPIVKRGGGGGGGGGKKKGIIADKLLNNEMKVTGTPYAFSSPSAVNNMWALNAKKEEYDMEEPIAVRSRPFPVLDLNEMPGSSMLLRRRLLTAAAAAAAAGGGRGEGEGEGGGEVHKRFQAVKGVCCRIEMETLHQMTSSAFYLHEKPAVMSFMEYSFFLHSRNISQQANVTSIQSQAAVMLTTTTTTTTKYVNEVLEVGYATQKTILSLIEGSSFLAWINDVFYRDTNILITTNKARCLRFFTARKWMKNPSFDFQQQILDDQTAIMDIARTMLTKIDKASFQVCDFDAERILVKRGFQPCCFLRNNELDTVDYKTRHFSSTKDFIRRQDQASGSPVIIPDRDLFNRRKHEFVSDWEKDRRMGEIAGMVKELLRKCSFRPFTPVADDCSPAWETNHKKRKGELKLTWSEYAINVLPKKLRVIAKYFLHLIDFEVDETEFYKTKSKLFAALIHVCKLPIKVEDCIAGKVEVLHSLVTTLITLKPTFPKTRLFFRIKNITKVEFLARRLWSQFKRVSVLKHKKCMLKMEAEKEEFEVNAIACLQRFCHQQIMNQQELASLAAAVEEGGGKSVVAVEKLKYDNTDMIGFQHLKSKLSTSPALTPKPPRMVKILGLHTAKGRFACRIKQLNDMNDCVKMVKHEPFALHVAMKVLLEMDFIPVYHYAGDVVDGSGEMVERQAVQHKRLIQEMMTICKQTAHDMHKEQSVTIQEKRMKQAWYVQHLQEDEEVKKRMELVKKLKAQEEEKKKKWKIGFWMGI